MPKRRKSNLSKKSKKSSNLKDVNTSLSEEDYNKMLEAQRIRREKYKQNQSSKQKAKELEGQKIRDNLNNSRILREHNESIHSQVVSRTRGALKRKCENQINPPSKKHKQVILLLYFHVTC
jgi:hypothetical protein